MYADCAASGKFSCEIITPAALWIALNYKNSSLVIGVYILRQAIRTDMKAMLLYAYEQGFTGLKAATRRVKRPLDRIANPDSCLLQIDSPLRQAIRRNDQHLRDLRRHRD